MAVMQDGKSSHAQLCRGGRSGGRAKTVDKSGKQVERCAIASFRFAESMGFKGDFRQWEDLLRVGD